jgi:hypothetical protein
VVILAADGQATAKVILKQQKEDGKTVVAAANVRVAHVIPLLLPTAQTVVHAVALPQWTKMSKEKLPAWVAALHTVRVTLMSGTARKHAERADWVEKPVGVLTTPANTNINKCLFDDRTHKRFCGSYHFINKKIRGSAIFFACA